MPNFTGKSGGGPHLMKKYGQGKNPIMMSTKQKENLPPELVAEIAKKEGNPPTNMGHAMKKYGAHKMSHPMKGYKSDAQRKAVHASKADGGKGNPNKMYKK
jgi:hypothetical protein